MTRRGRRGGRCDIAAFSLESRSGGQYDAADSPRPKSSAVDALCAVLACGVRGFRSHTEGEGEFMRKHRYALGATFASLAIVLLAACQSNTGGGNSASGGPTSTLKIGVVTDVGTL